MDMTTNGYSGCTRHFPIQTGFHLYFHGRVTGIADDMVIAGRDDMEHDRNFLVFMEKCMSNNLTPNLEKIQFKQSQISFYGHCMAKAWNLTRSKENSGTNSYGVPTGQGNYEIFPRYDQLPQQILCTQCTPHCTSQRTHTSGHRLQARKSAF